MINYNWHLNNVDLKYLPETNEAQILEIHWGCIATDDADPDNPISAVGSVSVADDNYIFPAATVKNATKQDVFQWLNNKLGDEKEQIKDNLAGQLAARSLVDSFVPVD
jgi:hypothetical protein